MIPPQQNQFRPQPGMVRPPMPLVRPNQTPTHPMGTPNPHMLARPPIPQQPAPQAMSPQGLPASLSPTFEQKLVVPLQAMNIQSQVKCQAQLYM